MSVSYCQREVWWEDRVRWLQNGGPAGHQEKPESAPIRFQALGWYKIAWNPTVPFEGLTIASIVDSQR